MHLCSIDQAVEHVLSHLPAHIHMGLPLGLGKPNASSMLSTPECASCPNGG